MEKTVSVIIPMYSYGKYLDEAIQSVLNQSVLAHEIICVSDGAIDNSVEIAKKYPVKIIEKEKGDEYSVATDTVRCWLDEEERHDSQEPALPMLGIDSTISQTGGRVEYNNMGYNGFSKREYAAIKLRVPIS